jgi:hypothetical protein
MAKDKEGTICALWTPERRVARNWKLMSHVRVYLCICQLQACRHSETGLIGAHSWSYPYIWSATVRISKPVISLEHGP